MQRKKSIFSSLFSRVRGAVAAIGHHVRGSYNAASMTADSRAAFAGSDFLSADAALQQNTRRLIAARARNEFANNSYAYGIIETLANDTIGRGPRLQLEATERADDARLQARETRFAEWARAVNLTAMLRTARMAKAIDGEVFIRLHTNPGARREIKLEPRQYEQEIVASEAYAGSRVEYYDTGVPVEIDGIRFDKWGNPVAYRFWRIHPGETYAGAATWSSEVPAREVLHYANIIRAGQHRGVSEFVAGLNIFNDLRRFSVAVVNAAELAARISFVISNSLPPEEYDASLGADEDGNPVSALDAQGGPGKFIDGQLNALVLPAGYNTQQMHAEQPTNTYQSFRDAKIMEAARVFNMPFNIAAGNSSSYNYASGRLDHQVYHKALLIERDNVAIRILDPIFEAWQEQDALLHPEDYRDAQVRHLWMWDGFEHVDPVKEANAQAARLANGVTTLAEECAREGRDYLSVLRQRQREIDYCRENGITPPPWMNASDTLIANDNNKE